MSPETRRGVRPWAAEGEEENLRKKEVLFKALLINSASFLLPEPEGRNKIGKMVLVICPESITQTWLRQWYKAIAIQQPGDQAFGMWWHPGGFAGPTLSQEPTCHAMGYLQIQEFKANL